MSFVIMELSECGEFGLHKMWGGLLKNGFSLKYLPTSHFQANALYFHIGTLGSVKNFL